MNRTEKIKGSLRKNRMSLAFGIPNSKFVQNVGGMIRTSNAFLLSKVVLSDENFKRHCAVGAHKWEDIIVTKDVIEYLKNDGYKIIALEQTNNSIPLWNFSFPEKSAIIIGHESSGNPQDVLDKSDFVVEIPQYGLVESLNVETAASIAAYEYMRQYKSGHDA
jgi:tRNA G18 (ribose-2'-O)-methylase SpoU